MKKLVIVAEVPDNWASAMEYGTGLLEEWAEDALGATLEGDFTEGQWAEDVERLYGVKWDGARNAFNVIEARFVEGNATEGAQVEMELARTLSKLAEEGAREGFDVDEWAREQGQEMMERGRDAGLNPAETLAAAEKAAAVLSSRLAAFMEATRTAAREWAAGRTELLTVELDGKDISLLERLAEARGVTQEECLRQLVIEACQASPYALGAAAEGGAA